MQNLAVDLTSDPDTHSDIEGHDYEPDDALEDDAQLVDEGDVDVALRVFDDLGGLSYFDGWCQMSTCCNHRFVKFIDFFSNFSR